MEEGRQGEATVVAGPGSGARKLYLESYGCQMNFSDSEIVASILADAGYQTTRDADDADLVLLNTCFTSKSTGYNTCRIVITITR